MAKTNHQSIRVTSHNVAEVVEVRLTDNSIVYNVRFLDMNDYFSDIPAKNKLSAEIIADAINNHAA